ncbi:MAG: extracellular solute-binding protein [bacterium]
MRRRDRGGRRGQLHRRYAIGCVVLWVIVLAGWLALVFLRPPPQRLTVYCAHDSTFSDPVLRRFGSQTRTHVNAVHDTEATKSLGLVERLIREKDSPRCDVFWNNQLLGTLDLHGRGILKPYKGPGFERIPAQYKDPQGHWVGFAARFRVYIINTEAMEATPEAVTARLESDDLSRVAIAKPLYGTTLTHYSVLWQRWGEEKLKAWHQSCRDRGMVEATGNAHVKDMVANGVCDLGFTDTDDFFVAKREGKPVALLPVRLDDGATICMPNTVALIQGTKHAERGQAFVDYLLSAECELALSNSDSRQVPLGPVDESKLNDEVRLLKTWVADGVSLTDLAEARSACLAWLKELYVQ